MSRRGSVRAVVFCSRPEELIQDGLPPSARYLNLIRSGAKEWGLHPSKQFQVAVTQSTRVTLLLCPPPPGVNTNLVRS